MKKILLAIFIFVNSAPAQIIEWQKCLGGTNDDIAFSIFQTNDGGYVIAGNSGSNDGDVSGNHSLDYDYWIVKIDNLGNLQWQKCYGGTLYDVATSIIQTNDNGYLVAGTTHCNDGDVSGFHGTADYWVIKLDGSGNLQWQKCLGGTSGEAVFASTAIVQHADSSYLISGFATSNNGDVSGNHGTADCWLVKLDTGGNLQWQKCRGGSGGDSDYVPITKTFDGGYAITCRTGSNDGDVSGNRSTNGFDIWLAKLDSAAELQWQRCLGGSDNDEALEIVQCSDSGYFLVGGTYSNDGDISSTHGGGDVWVIKTSSTGSIQWQKCLGGTYGDGGYSGIQTADGGYVIAGITQSNNGDVTGHHNAPNTFTDCWIVKLDPAGDIQWRYCFGGEKDDKVYSIIQTVDGGYIFAGATESTGWDVSGFHGGAGRDVWVVKLSPLIGMQEANSTLDFNTYPNPTTGTFSLELPNQLFTNSTVTVFNSLGDIIFKHKILNLKSEIDLSNYPEGIYFVKVLQGDKMAVKKIVKM